MKKSLYVIAFLMLLIIVFWGGARFNQHEASRNTSHTGDRHILHYVDPMNPAHTSQEPGIAPCGMPMEPVYADTNTPSGLALMAPPGAVNINLQKQQIIGVQVGEVTKGAQTFTIRALGRIEPDENRIYPLIAPTDGWVEEINEGTTGSMVNANQLMAQIRVYNYDFYNQQLRYLSEQRNNSKMSMPPSGPEQARPQGFSENHAVMSNPEPEAQTTKPPIDTPQEAAAAETVHMTEPSLPPDTPLLEKPPPVETTQPSNQSEESQPPENRPQGSLHQEAKPMAGPHKHPLKLGADHSIRAGIRNIRIGEQTSIPLEMGTLIPSQWWVALMNFGVNENQLKEFAESGTYISHTDLRSPVNGLVLSRKVSPLQKIDRGVECFRIADLSRVWIETDIYDTEAKYLQPGTPAKISMPKQDTHFAASVSTSPPRFDATARSFKLRLEMDNPDQAFRPDMFVDVEFLVQLPETITVPSSAVIDSGTRKTVYVVKGEGLFEPRAVETGWQGNDRVEIVKGLQPGEKIVVSGNFLIDSESRMQLANAKLMEDKAEKTINGQMPLPTAVPESQQPAQSSMTNMTKEASEQTTKDPICGMTIDRDKAKAAGLTVEVGGKTFYFCSIECKTQFEQEPHHQTGEKVGHQIQTDAHSGHHHD